MAPGGCRAPRRTAPPWRNELKLRSLAMRARWALVALLLGTPAAARDTAAQDKLLGDALKEMHNKAAELYNGGDPNGCDRLFQGGLYTIRPLLAHRPDLQQAIDEGMQA